MKHPQLIQSGIGAILAAMFALPVTAAEQERTYSARNEDRATACSLAKSMAAEAAKRAIGNVRLKRTSACDCSQSEEPYSKNKKWTCMTDAVFE